METAIKDAIPYTMLLRNEILGINLRTHIYDAYYENKILQKKIREVVNTRRGIYVQ